MLGMPHELKVSDEMFLSFKLVLAIAAIGVPVIIWLIRLGDRVDYQEARLRRLERCAAHSCMEPIMRLRGHED